MRHPKRVVLRESRTENPRPPDRAASEVDPVIWTDLTIRVKLFVRGLSFSTTPTALRDHFTCCGSVVSARVITDRFTRQSRGFGFVEMAREPEAQAAIAKLNGRPLKGRRLTVSLAIPQTKRSSAPGSAGARGGRFGSRSGFGDR